MLKKSAYTRNDLENMNRLSLLAVADDCGLDPAVCSKGEFDGIVQLILAAGASYNPNINAEERRLAGLARLTNKLFPHQLRGIHE